MTLSFTGKGAEAVQTSQVVEKATAATETVCPSARRALSYYRIKWATWREMRGLPTAVKLRQPHGCAHTRWATSQWALKARSSRLSYKQWLEDRWIVREQGDWQRATGYVQRWFPGTQSWLLSCSDAEGGHGEWVTYGGKPRSYWAWAKANYVVGGWMQFKWPTFNGMYRLAYEHLRSKGYRLHLLPAPGDTRGWLSPTAQALAAAWARYTGEDDSHWSASWNNGC